MGERTFDYSGLVDELRCHTTEWLEAARAEAVREQRRWRMRELAIVRVLDERGRVDDTLAAGDGVSVRELRDTVETARALDALPEIARVAHDGRLSNSQLSAVIRLAEPDDDADWARRAPHCATSDLERLARTKRTPSAEEGQARRRARNLGFWWREADGMLDGRFSLPDVDGALFERVLNQMIDKMKPAKGQPWETRARRGADALVELVRNYAHVEAPSGPDPYFSVHIPPEGPAEIGPGIPLPAGMVEKLRAHAKIAPTLTDQQGMPVTYGRTTPALPRRVVQGVLKRDAKCRVDDCDRREGLRVVHLLPVSWGGTDDQSNLAAVCEGGGTDHISLLAPTGRHLLLGNPNHPGGLDLIHLHDLHGLAAMAAERARAKPEAA